MVYGVNQRLERVFYIFSVFFIMFYSKQRFLFVENNNMCDIKKERRYCTCSGCFRSKVVNRLGQRCYIRTDSFRRKRFKLSPSASFKNELAEVVRIAVRLKYVGAVVEPERKIIHFS